MRYEVNPRNPVTPKVISFDTEYSDLNIRKAEFLSASIGVSENLTYIFDKSGMHQLNDLLQKAEIIFCWNMTVDWYIIRHRFNRPNGICIRKDKIIDGMLMEHLIDERLPHSLGEFAKREYNDDYKDTFWKKYNSYQEAEKDIAYDYEMRDGIYTYRAGVRYLEVLRSNMELVRHAHRLQWALFDTEIKGIKVDKPLMVKTKAEMSAKINMYLPKLREEFNDYCKVWELSKWQEEISKRKSDRGRMGVTRPEFSFTSDRQLSWLLYDGLEIPVVEKTKKGQPSTNTDALKELAKSYPEIQTIVDYKETKAVYSTFVEGMLERVEDDCRIYPGFFINGTATGRISHNNPNMGNLPSTGVIRNFFVPDNGNCIVGADYSQLEVVVEANLTEDPSLLKIINEGMSKHDITAEGLGITRDQAKTLNFALQYGAGVFKVSKILDVSRESAQDIFDRYWKLYSGVKSLKDKTTQELARSGAVTNLFGRTRHFVKPNNEFEKAKQERQAYNFLVQGVGADITNRATYLIAEMLKQDDYGRLWFSVHDEIVCEVERDYTEIAKHAIVFAMESVNEYVKFKYPVRAKAYGPMICWGKA